MKQNLNKFGLVAVLGLLVAGNSFAEAPDISALTTSCTDICTAVLTAVGTIGAAVLVIIGTIAAVRKLASALKAG